ncbi:OsmC family peroxiredoxin [Epilithonimonas vandammei]|uniref:OsmC family peroxiredoxin n=1 Tax=Epilithonimonas vandammei TaxID=2487072 RepID=A0A3G8ZBJ4_9FLAO|nr:OsmC family protein [Epilithonimonas vandammei]AZI54085.1 OsmC family peroxiredoxin [Epilithonimonas vandammei]
MKRSANAVWKGTVKDGNGVLTTQSTTLNETQYSFKSRFEEGVGTNPEELLAAAHAGCFTMKTSALLTEAGYIPETLETDCKISLDDGKVTLSELTLNAKVPAISEEDFQKIAKEAKETCPISVAFSFDKTLTANLIN